MPSWWDRFGQEWATQGTTDDPTNAQSDAGWAFIGQAPPTVEQFNSMFQWNDDKDNWLYGQILNVIASANIVPDPDDLTQLLQAINSKNKLLLVSNLNIYVDAINGNDTTGTGEQATPWKTIQHAYNWVRTNVETAGYAVVCNLRPGTYAPLQVAGTPINGAFFVYGDPLNQRSYIVKSTNGTAISSWYGCGLYIQGISIEAVGGDVDYNTWGCGILANNGGFIVYQDISFGPCSANQMIAQLAGVVWPAQGASTKYTIYGGAQAHYAAAFAGDVTTVQLHTTIQNNPNFTNCFAFASLAGSLNCWGQVFTGTCQGRKAVADANSIININGVDPNTFFPGTSNAIAQRGGLII